MRPAQAEGRMSETYDVIVPGMGYREEDGAELSVKNVISLYAVGAIVHTGGILGSALHALGRMHGIKTRRVGVRGLRLAIEKAYRPFVVTVADADAGVLALARERSAYLVPVIRG